MWRAAGPRCTVCKWGRGGGLLEMAFFIQMGNVSLVCVCLSSPAPQILLPPPSSEQSSVAVNESIRTAGGLFFLPKEQCPSMRISGPLEMIARSVILLSPRSLSPSPSPCKSSAPVIKAEH